MRRQEKRTVSLKQFFKRKGRRIAVLTCGIYLVHIVAPVYYAKLQAELYMRVSGKVTDKITGQGVQNAVVLMAEIQQGQPLIARHSALTNKDGKYVVNMVPPGEYLAFAFPPENSHYGLDLTQRKITVERGKNVINMDFQLDLGGTLSGTVYAADGITPLPDALVVAFSQHSSGNALSDASGKFTIHHLKRELYTVGVVMKGYMMSLKENVVLSETGTIQNFRINTDISTSFAGVVRSTLGVPIPNAYILITQENNGGISSTNEQGIFRIAGITAGTYQIAVIAKGYKVLKHSDVEISRQQKNTIEFTLEPLSVESSMRGQNNDYAPTVCPNSTQRIISKTSYPFKELFHKNMLEISAYAQQSGGCIDERNKCLNKCIQDISEWAKPMREAFGAAALNCLIVTGVLLLFPFPFGPGAGFFLVQCASALSIVAVLFEFVMLNENIDCWLDCPSCPS